MKKRLTIAVDFDGTIVENDFPRIGKVKQDVVDKIREWWEAGHTIIIWTCRTDKYLGEAIDFLVSNSIPYHAINENYNTKLNCRKVLADIYLDDRALNVDDLEDFDINSLQFRDSEDILDDIMTLICKVNELSIHAVDSDLTEVKEIALKYGL